MDDTLESKKKDNIFLEFIKAWLYIFLYAFKGIKFLLIDIWVILFNYFSYNLNKTYQKVTAPSNNINEDQVNEIYQKTKLKHQKKQKIYHYSKQTMAKYEKLKKTLAIDLQNAGATRTKNPNVYKYIVKNPNDGGKIFSGTMSGFSKLDINSFLVNEGYEVYDIKTSEYINFIYKDSSLFGQKISVKDLVFWLTQLSTYLKAGITLTEGVKILSMQMANDPTKQRIYRAICYELSLGESFSNALAKQGNFFPALLINMIKAAEATGTIQETLEDMSNYYTEINNTKKEMTAALIYPAIISVFSVAVLTFIIVYVVPQFTTIYSQSDIEIKGITAFIVALSAFLQKHIITVILVFVLFVIILVIAYKKIKAFKTFCQIIFMRLPIIKNVIIYKEITIFSKTFASLLRNNVFITESMDILSKITENEVYKAIMFKTINNIVKGEKISQAFENHWAVPEVAYHMIVTGESTGQLGDMMQKVSEYYSSMHKNIVNSLKSFIEPVMIIFLAVMVAIIIIAVIVPMFQLYNQIL